MRYAFFFVKQWSANMSDIASWMTSYHNVGAAAAAASSERSTGRCHGVY